MDNRRKTLSVGPGFLFAAFAALALAGTDAAQVVRLDFIAASSENADINDVGQVVGIGGSYYQSQVWRFTDGIGVQTLVSADSHLILPSVNSAGQIAYTSVTNEGYRAYRHTDGAGPLEIGLQGQAYLTAAINSHGDVVGSYLPPNSGYGQSWRFRDGVAPQPLALGLPDGGSNPVAMNNAGQIALTVEAPSTRAHAYRFQDGLGLLNLGTLGGDRSIAQGMNAHGDVFGWSRASDGAFQNFLYTDGNGMVSLGSGASDGGPNFRDINDQQWLVGELWGPTRPVLWTPQTGLINLNNLLSPGTDAELFDATAVNNRGQIVGRGRVGTQWGTYRLTVEQLPSPPTVFVAAAFLIVLWRRR